ncbi:hypothetical protein Pelo_16869 [Pelomyxa schiedti]|nr:hypothetical protein Pelo_16869 [Pelomyxa schiedti]
MIGKKSDRLLVVCKKLAYGLSTSCLSIPFEIENVDVGNLHRYRQIPCFIHPKVFLMRNTLFNIGQTRKRVDEFFGKMLYFLVGNPISHNKSQLESVFLCNGSQSYTNPNSLGMLVTDGTNFLLRADVTLISQVMALLSAGHVRCGMGSCITAAGRGIYKQYTAVSLVSEYLLRTPPIFEYFTLEPLPPLTPHHVLLTLNPHTMGALDARVLRAEPREYICSGVRDNLLLKTCGGNNTNCRLISLIDGTTLYSKIVGQEQIMVTSDTAIVALDRVTKTIVVQALNCGSPVGPELRDNLPIPKDATVEKAALFHNKLQVWFKTIGTKNPTVNKKPVSYLAYFDLQCNSGDLLIEGRCFKLPSNTFNVIPWAIPLVVQRNKSGPNAVMDIRTKKALRWAPLPFEIYPISDQFIVTCNNPVEGHIIGISPEESLVVSTPVPLQGLVHRPPTVPSSCTIPFLISHIGDINGTVTRQTFSIEAPVIEGAGYKTTITPRRLCVIELFRLPSEKGQAFLISTTKCYNLYYTTSPLFLTPTVPP